MSETKTATAKESKLTARELKVRLTFLEDLLGTAPANPNLHEEFIASKAPNPETIEQEIEAIGVDGVVEKGMTIFPKTADGTPFVYDYQIRGFFKESAGFLKQVPGMKSYGLKAHKKKIDGLIFVEPRVIPISLNGMMIDNCQRPLRASTPQGERESLANSESIPTGSTIEFTVICYIGKDMELVKEWLKYGGRHGLGQWRNSGKGKFSVEFLEERELDII